MPATRLRADAGTATGGVLVPAYGRSGCKRTVDGLCARASSTGDDRTCDRSRLPGARLARAQRRVVDRWDRDADRPGRRHGAPTNRTVEPSNPRHLACHHIVWMQHRAYIHRDWRMHAPVGDQFDAVLIIGYRGVAAVQTSECIGLMERSVHGNRDHGQIRVTTVRMAGICGAEGTRSPDPHTARGSLTVSADGAPLTGPTVIQSRHSPFVPLGDQPSLHNLAWRAAPPLRPPQGSQATV